MVTDRTSSYLTAPAQRTASAATPEQSADRLQQLGYAIAIHPSAALAHSALGALTAMCQLRGIKPDEFLPTRPEEFFNLVGMADWFDLGQRYQPAAEGRGA